MAVVEIKQMERQLILYELFTYFSEEKVTYRDIDFVLPGLTDNRRTLQRDIRDLTQAGLICVRYSKEEGGYVWVKECEYCQEGNLEDENHLPQKNKDDKRQLSDKKMQHIRRLCRLVECMRLTGCQDVVKEYFDRFPDCTERMRLRDFQILRNIGYEAGYSRECETVIISNDYVNPLDGYGVYRKNGKMVRCR